MVRMYRGAARHPKRLTKLRHGLGQRIFSHVRVGPGPPAGLLGHQLVGVIHEEQGRSIAATSAPTAGRPGTRDATAIDDERPEAIGCGSHQGTDGLAMSGTDRSPARKIYGPANRSISLDQFSVQETRLLSSVTHPNQ
jgi:hypothetical protein